MPRKKLQKPKAKKMTTKRPRAARLGVKLSSLTMQQDFQTLIRALPAQFKKDAVLLKAQEKKLKAALQKALAQYKTAKDTQATVVAKNKGKTPTALKKLVANAQKAYAKASKALDSLNDQAAAVKTYRQKLVEQQALFAAYRKQLQNLQKQPVAKTEEKPKAKAKTTKTKRAAKPARQDLPVVNPAEEAESIATTSVTPMPESEMEEVAEMDDVVA